MSQTHKPRVLLDGRLLGTRSGGIARYVDELARAFPMVAPDLDIRLLVRSGRQSAIDSPLVSPVRTFTPPHHRFERWALGLEAALRRPRLVHSPDFIQPIVPMARTIITIHDLAFLDADGEAALTPDSLRYYRQVARLGSQANAIITVSHYVKNSVVERLHVPESRIQVIYNGVTRLRQAEPLSDDDNSDPPDSVHLAIDSRRPIILMLGTIEPRKRHDLLLDALEVSQTRQLDPRPFLVVVGGPGWNCDATVARLSELNTSGNGCWLGAASDGLLGRLLRHATLLAMPSRDEGFGLPVLEAMAVGLPVVASNRGALPEIGGNAAELVESDTAEEWSETIDSLLSDDARRSELSQAGLLRASEFSWERTATETAKLYREVLEK